MKTEGTNLLLLTISTYYVYAFMRANADSQRPDIQSGCYMFYLCNCMHRRLTWG